MKNHALSIKNPQKQIPVLDAEVQLLGSSGSDKALRKVVEAVEELLSENRRDKSLRPLRAVVVLRSNGSGPYREEQKEQECRGRPVRSESAASHGDRGQLKLPESVNSFQGMEMKRRRRTVSDG